MNQKKFSKHILLKEIGLKGQEKISTARIIIVGLGGLGTSCIRYLASSGVGNLILIDDDIIELDNLPRQNNFTEKDLDKTKAEVSEKIIKELNPTINVVTYDKRADEKFLSQIITECDMIIDGSDNFKTKFLLNDLCIKYKKTYISASFVGYKGYLSVYKPYLSDDLPCFRCFHPEDIDSSQDRACFNQGVFAPGVGAVGCFMAGEALKEVTDMKSLSGKIIIYNFLDNTHRVSKITRRLGCKHNL